MMFATEDIFKQYYKALCHFAWTMVSDMELARDIVQDAFVAFHHKRAEIAEDPVAIKNYLFSSVKFSCYNLYRKAKIENRFWEKSGLNEVYDSEIELNIIKSEVIAEILKIVETMPHACAEVFKKGYLEGLSNLEIAQELRISVNTVKTQKQRGIKFLKDKLHPEFLILAVCFLEK